MAEPFSLAEFLQSETLRLPALLTLAAADGVATDRSIETLPRFLEWLADFVTVDAVEAPADAPPWAREILAGSTELDGGSAALVRTAAYYLGEVFLATFSQLSWAVGDPGYAEAGRPVVRGFAHAMDLDVESVTANIVRSAAAGDRSRVSAAIDWWATRAHVPTEPTIAPSSKLVIWKTRTQVDGTDLGPVWIVDSGNPSVVHETVDEWMSWASALRFAESRGLKIEQV